MRFFRSTRIWLILLSILIPAARFTIRRLIINYKPEEKVKK